MKNVKILEGPCFDWKSGIKANGSLVDDNDNINWGAAFAVDPGVMSCPKCKEFYWREGTKVECTACGSIWYPNGHPLILAASNLT